MFHATFGIYIVKKYFLGLGVVVHVYNLSTLEAEAGGL
jgi:hypothetical protein